MEPLLQEIDPQHPFQPHRVTPAVFKAGYTRAMTAQRGAQGTTRVISARNTSRRVILQKTQLRWPSQRSSASWVWFPCGGFGGILILEGDCREKNYAEVP